MVAASEQVDKAREKEIADAQTAKKKVDPDKNDPNYEPNLKPQTGKKAASKAKTSAKATTTKKATVAKKATEPTALEAAQQYDSVDVSVDGDETRMKPSPDPAKRTVGDVRVDPPLGILQGHVPTFVAPEGKGRVMAKIITPRQTVWVVASNGNGDARVSKVMEGPGDVTVEFYDDGKLYASGTWSVG